MKEERKIHVARRSTTEDELCVAAAGVNGFWDTVRCRSDSCGNASAMNYSANNFGSAADISVASRPLHVAELARKRHSGEQCQNWRTVRDFKELRCGKMMAALGFKTNRS